MGEARCLGQLGMGKLFRGSWMLRVVRGCQLFGKAGMMGKPDLLESWVEVESGGWRNMV